uniref:Uncharacterized protein n=1 Tax=Opuntia streptacantha TaxID=393608 RepID=A0A7C9D6X7_OPUST
MSRNFITLQQQRQEVNKKATIQLYKKDLLMLKKRLQSEQLVTTTDIIEKPTIILTLMRLHLQIQYFQLRLYPWRIVIAVHPQSFPSILVLEIRIFRIFLVFPVIPPLQRISKEGLPKFLGG